MGNSGLSQGSSASSRSSGDDELALGHQAEKLASMGQKPSAASSHTVELLSGFEDSYQLLAEIGRGTYSIVYSARHIKTDQEVAVKVIDSAAVGAKYQAFLARELECMIEVTHQSLLQFYGAYQDDSGRFTYVVTGLAEEDLLNHLQNTRRQLYSEAEVRLVATQLLSALAHLHAQGWAHRDVKPENIYLTNPGDSCSLVIGDLGFAIKPSLVKGNLAPCGTPQYCAPELLLRKTFDGKVDVWSTGVTLYALLIGNLPFGGSSMEEMFEAVLEGDYIAEGRAWNNLSSGVRHFIHCMLQADANKRWSADELLEHPWLNGFM